MAQAQLHAHKPKTWFYRQKTCIEVAISSLRLIQNWVNLLPFYKFWSIQKEKIPC